MEVRQWKTVLHCEPLGRRCHGGPDRFRDTGTEGDCRGLSHRHTALERCRNGKRYLHQGGFEESLRANERHTSLIKFEPLDKDRMRNNLSMYRDLSSKPIKGRSSNPCIMIPVEVHETISIGTQF